MSDSAPVAVGGVGGSGTRVVAAVLKEAGLRIGDDLNHALDNCWFTLLFKHRDVLDASRERFAELVALFVAAMTGGQPPTPAQSTLIDELAGRDRLQHDSAWLQERAQSLRAALEGPARTGPWGWKEPNTHMVVDHLAQAIPELRYIHVVRNGLDMAYSSNQNQLQLWGPLALGVEHANTPRNALKFWSWAHARILGIGAELGPRFLLVRFEDLCAHPQDEVRHILSFVGANLGDDAVQRAARAVVRPESIGRRWKGSLADFDAADVAFVHSVGFNTSA